MENKAGKPRGSIMSRANQPINIFCVTTSTLCTIVIFKSTVKNPAVPVSLFLVTFYIIQITHIFNTQEYENHFAQIHAKSQITMPNSKKYTVKVCQINV